MEADRGSASIPLGEVIEVLKQLYSGKAPRIDEIRPEMLKALGVKGLSWLTRLFKIVWKSGTDKGVANQGGGSPVQKGEPECVCLL